MGHRTRAGGVRPEPRADRGCAGHHSRGHSRPSRSKPMRTVTTSIGSQRPTRRSAWMSPQLAISAQAGLCSSILEPTRATSRTLTCTGCSHVAAFTPDSLTATVDDWAHSTTLPAEIANTGWAPLDFSFRAKVHRFRADGAGLKRAKTSCWSPAPRRSLMRSQLR